MLIGIDTRFAVHDRRGIGNYTLKLIQNLAEMDFQNDYILYTDRNDSDHVLPQRNNFKIKRLSPANYFIWEQIILPREAKNDALDILHCTGNTAPILLHKEIRLISTIHDVMFMKGYSELPKSSSLYQRAGRIYRRAIVPRTIKRLSMVLTVSEFSKKDITQHLPDLCADTVEVIHEAAGENFSSVDTGKVRQILNDKFGIDGEYILTLGALDPRKNTESVIINFMELKAEHKIKSKLVIVGIPNWREAKFNQMVRKSAFANDILFTEFVSEDDLICLYNGAKVFVYPSSYEGFGIPPLEAMACGTPVITSNTTSIPEIVGKAALLINPADSGELKDALLRVLNEPILRKDLISRGLEQAKIFSWKRLARETLLAYEKVYKR